jgi:uncharacterized protein YqhQ
MADNLDTTQTSASSMQPNEQPNKPTTLEKSKKFGHFLLAIFGILAVLVFILPNSSTAQALAFPILLFGTVAGIKFFVDSIISTREKNPVVRTFLVLGGLGVGIVIFFIFLILGLGVAAAKDPHPQNS